MNKICNIAIVLALFGTLLGCGTAENLSTQTTAFFTRSEAQYASKKHYLPTDPTSVILLSVKKLETPYRVIGEVHVNKRNLVGIKRQLGVINDLLQSNAASIGGNAIVDIEYGSEEATGKVIRFVS